MSWVRAAAASGFLGVALGAFGAHALKARLTPQMLANWNTGVLYHLLHTVVLLAVALYARSQGTSPGAAAPLLVAGIGLFSGSLYLMALTGVTKLGAVTPLGGLCFLAAWIAIGLGLAR